MAANELPSSEAGAGEADVGGGGGGGGGAAESNGGGGGGAGVSEGGVGGGGAGVSDSGGVGGAEELTGGIGEMSLAVFEILDISLPMDFFLWLSLLLNLFVILCFSDSPFVEEDLSTSTC